MKRPSPLAPRPVDASRTCMACRFASGGRPGLAARLLGARPGEGATCGHPAVARGFVDPVTGARLVEPQACRRVRSPVGLCGPEGKLFEALPLPAVAPVEPWPGPPASDPMQRIPPAVLLAGAAFLSDLVEREGEVGETVGLQALAAALRHQAAKAEGKHNA